MSLFEQYGMGIPILVPSVEFLWQLHDKYDVVTERTWIGCGWGFGRQVRDPACIDIVRDAGPKRRQKPRRILALGRVWRLLQVAAHYHI